MKLHVTKNAPQSVHAWTRQVTVCRSLSKVLVRLRMTWQASKSALVRCQLVVSWSGMQYGLSLFTVAYLKNCGQQVLGLYLENEVLADIHTYIHTYIHWYERCPLFGVRVLTAEVLPSISDTPCIFVYVRICVCVWVCTYVCIMYVRTYVCMYVYACVYVRKVRFWQQVTKAQEDVLIDLF
jgi:hypothetical protein